MKAVRMVQEGHAPQTDVSIFDDLTGTTPIEDITEETPAVTITATDETPILDPTETAEAQQSATGRKRKTMDILTAKGVKPTDEFFGLDPKKQSELAQAIQVVLVIYPPLQNDTTQTEAEHGKILKRILKGLGVDLADLIRYNLLKPEIAALLRDSAGV